MARLPDHYIRKTLRDLPIGGSAWTVPWAMTVTKEECYLSLGHSPHNRPGATVQMLVTHRPDGWVVDIRSCPFQWDRSDHVSADAVRIVELIHEGGIER